MSGYRFPPVVRVGFLLGLSRLQVILLGTAVATIVVSQMAGGLVVGILAAVLLSVAAVGSWRGEPVRAKVASMVGWRLGRALGRDRWAARIGQPGQVWPPILHGLRVRASEPQGAWPSGLPLGIVEHGTGSSVVIPVRGPQMALLAEHEAAERLSAWGDVLASTCTELGENGIVRIAWTDVHSAADPTALVRHHERSGVAGPTTSDYLDHIGSVGGVSSDHQVYVTITATARSVRQSGAVSGRHANSSRGRLDDALIDQAGALCRELASRGFQPGRPLPPVSIARLVRQLGDPWSTGVAGADSAMERLGIAVPGETGPLVVTARPKWVEIDSAIHRTYQLVWPARAVPADWVWHLLAAAGGPKTMTVVFEPIPPSRSQRRLATEMSRVASDNEVRARRQMRVSEARRRLQGHLEDRERELVSGHGEMHAYALVTVTAQDAEDLEARSVAIERAAHRCGGARLRPLERRHDLGWAACLPLGIRTDAPRS